MLSQVRIYKINPGQLDNWLSFFHSELVPVHQQAGIEIRGAWVNRDTDEFIWIREFTGAGSMEEQEQAYNTSDARRRIGDKPKKFVKEIVVKPVEKA